MLYEAMPKDITAPKIIKLMPMLKGLVCGFGLGVGVLA